MVRKIKSYNFKFDYNMFQNDVQAFLDAHNFKRHELDELAGCGTGITSAILNDKNHNHKIETVLKIANAMDVDVRTYFVLDV